MSNLNDKEKQLQDLLDAAKRLQDEIAEAKKKEEEEKRKNIPVAIKAAEYNPNNKLIILNVTPVRDDVHSFLIGVKGVSWNSYNPGRYYCSLNVIPEVRKVAELPNVTISSNKEVREIIEEFESKWDWRIRIDDPFVLCRYNIRLISTFEIASLPGSNVIYGQRTIKVPRAEAWRVYNKLKDNPNVEWESNSLDILKKELEKREELNTILQQEDFSSYTEIKFGNGTELHLKPFQSIGVRFGVLNGGRFLDADEMGLGKSPTALGFKKVMETELGRDLKTIVIVPAQLMVNWYREIKKWLPNSRIAIFKGLLPTQGDMVRMIEKNYDFALISYHSVGKEHKIEGSKSVNDAGYIVKEQDSKENLWVKLINLARFDYAIVDESHYIVNHESGRSVGVRSVNTPYLALLTGTPMVNRPGDLWALLNALDGDKFPSRGSFVSQYTVDGKTPRNVSELQEILRTYMFRRKKADVMKDLEPIRRIKYFHTLSEKGIKVYNKALQGVYEYIDALGNQWEKNIPNILVMLNRLKWICAIDKMETSADLARTIYDSSNEDKYGKVIIFSYWHNTVYGIKNRLMPESISFVEKSGSNYHLVANEERYKRCDIFSDSDDTNFLSVPLMATGEGLNITAAGSCIFNDMWWNPKAHEQAEGRAYGRVSDPHSISSYYVIAEGTIDEYLYELVWEDKAKTIEEVVDGVEVDRSDSIARKLIERIKEDAQKLNKEKGK